MSYTDCQANAFQYGSNGLADRYLETNVAQIYQVEEEVEDDPFLSRLSLPHDPTFIYSRPCPDSEGTTASERSTRSANRADGMVIGTPRSTEHSLPVSQETNYIQLSERTASSMTPHKRSKSDNELRVNKESRYGRSEGIAIHSTREEKSQPMRERNRQAAMRFRSRHRDSVAKLQSDEQAVEKRHHELCESVDILNGEILYLKMQVLQHIEYGCITVHSHVE
ncbi:hypothetical protein FGRMN_4396 [Fusarium graminum]|nr:hypothetical protein FGRMN_4396 [Fusarium graminum]